MIMPYQVIQISAELSDPTYITYSAVAAAITSSESELFSELLTSVHPASISALVNEPHASRWHTPVKVQDDYGLRIDIRTGRSC